LRRVEVKSPGNHCGGNGPHAGIEHGVQEVVVDGKAANARIRNLVKLRSGFEPPHIENLLSRKPSRFQNIKKEDNKRRNYSILGHRISPRRRRGRREVTENTKPSKCDAV